MAAATWAVSTTREGSNSKNQNQVEQEVERQKKVSNFVYASFPQEILKQIETLQFTDFTLTGHDRKSQIIKLENQVSPQEVRFNISEHKDSKGNTVIRDVIEVKSLVTGKYETFANINATDGKLPIGTTATGNIERGEVYTATITTKIPGLPQLNFQAKELQKFQCKDQNFSGEQVNLTIIKDKLEREDYVITFKSGNKEEKLGTLSKESVKVGIEQGWLAEKPGQSGQKLQLEITSIAIGENAFAIGKTSNGNLVRIDINDKLKNREFKGQEISVTIISIGSVAPRTTSEGIASAVITKYNQQVQLTQILAKLETNTVQTAYSGDSDRALYQSLINGLTEAASTGYKSIRIESSNNKFLENFLFCCPREDLKPLHEQAKTLLQQFDKHELSWQHSQINPAYQLARTTAHKLVVHQANFAGSGRRV
ncbi:reverse transcriptase-like protein [Tolypothrix sp. NIES-4075]|uniref:reverse transcriptase-like protein n=1 Tax=Tolypothrix sp. NIES-4075 TaxID=2005459 RepID=UPI00352BEE2A